MGVDDDPLSTELKGNGCDIHNGANNPSKPHSNNGVLIVNEDGLDDASDVDEDPEINLLQNASTVKDHNHKDISQSNDEPSNLNANQPLIADDDVSDNAYSLTNDSNDNDNHNVNKPNDDNDEDPNKFQRDIHDKNDTKDRDVYTGIQRRMYALRYNGDLDVMNEEHQNHQMMQYYEKLSKDVHRKGRDQNSVNINGGIQQQTAPQAKKNDADIASIATVDNHEPEANANTKVGQAP